VIPLFFLCRAGAFLFLKEGISLLDGKVLVVIASCEVSEPVNLWATRLSVAANHLHHYDTMRTHVPASITDGAAMM
jgi:hypothetical protein